MTDRLSPVFSLTPDERERVRALFEDDPDAVLPAITAALGHGERTLDLMRRVIEGVSPCSD